MTENREQELRWLKSTSGELATAVLAEMNNSLLWFKNLPAKQKAMVGLVAQRGVSSFTDWCHNPKDKRWDAAGIFSAASPDLIRIVSLQQTLQIIKIVIRVVETKVAAMSPGLKESVLIFSKDVAFAAADVYARAAESKESWDKRLEKIIIQKIIDADSPEEIRNHLAAIAWPEKSHIQTLVVTDVPSIDVNKLRRRARASGHDILISSYKQNLVIILTKTSVNKDDGSFKQIIEKMLPEFQGEITIIAEAVSSILNAKKAIMSAIAAKKTYQAWSDAPQVVHANDLLSERAIGGDKYALEKLKEEIYIPLKKLGNNILETIDIYIDLGYSIEKTARKLFVHPNTVRYRIKKSNEAISKTVNNTRDALNIKIAIIYGKISEESE